MTFLLFDFFILFFLKGSAQPPPLLWLLPSPLTRVLVWAFLLVPLAQPSFLETFLRLSTFPATSRSCLLLLPAGLRRRMQLLPTPHQPWTISFLSMQNEPHVPLLFPQMLTPVGRLLPVDAAGSYRMPISRDEDILACVCLCEVMAEPLPHALCA